MLLNAFKKLFKVSQPIIGSVHLKPLPGAPHAVTMDKVAEAALADAEAIVSGGGNALIVENFGDAPFYKDRVPAHTVAAVTTILTKLRDQFPKIPIGVNILRNDAAAALGIAAVTCADFIRVNIHSGLYATDQGLIEGRAHETLRLRESLRSRVLIFADVAVKHASPLDRRDIGELARETAGRGGADAIILTGARTGAQTSSAELSNVHAAVKCPVIIGSGITPEDIENYTKADGFIVGTYLKYSGDVHRAVDIERVRALVKAVKRLRRNRR